MYNEFLRQRARRGAGRIRPPRQTEQTWRPKQLEAPPVQRQLASKPSERQIKPEEHPVQAQEDDC